MKKTILSTIIALYCVVAVQAQQNRTKAIINAAVMGWKIELRAGYNLGGTAPLPLPQEIRSIESYNPMMAFSVETNISKWFGPEDKWGVITGVKLENKDMKTDARVKNYGMEIFGDNGERVAGRWTGGVQTTVENSFLTFPILGAYKVHKRTSIKAGVFLSYLLRGNFTGYVYDGYIRQEDPTGLKVEYTGDNTAPYDFSNQLRNFQWGVQLGADWEAFKHLKLYADLSWGLNDAFKKDFNTITFSMYPIYLNAGIAYLF